VYLYSVITYPDSTHPVPIQKRKCLAFRTINSLAYHDIDQKHSETLRFESITKISSTLAQLVLKSLIRSMLAESKN
jgi:hypothetical protein